MEKTQTETNKKHPALQVIHPLLGQGLSEKQVSDASVIIADAVDAATHANVSKGKLAAGMIVGLSAVSSEHAAYERKRASYSLGSSRKLKPETRLRQELENIKIPDAVIKQVQEALASVAQDIITNDREAVRA